MKRLVFVYAVALALAGAPKLAAQVAPSKAELASYAGLHIAAAKDDVEALHAALQSGSDINGRDARGRTPAMVATHLKAYDALAALIAAGADLDLLDQDRYDVLTIAAVADDVKALQMAIEAGANAKAVTSIYDGTALIAAAHLGHAEVVGALLAAGAPPDHVNNLGWTALIEAVVLGDGGVRHQATVRALIDGNADLNLPDGLKRTPLALARARNYSEIASLLEQAGARLQ